MTLDEFRHKTGLYIAIEQVGEHPNQFPPSKYWYHFCLLIGRSDKGEIQIPVDGQTSHSADYTFRQFVINLRCWEHNDFASFQAEYPELDCDNQRELFKRMGKLANLRKMLGEDYLTLIDEVVL